MTIVESFAEFMPESWFDRAGLRITEHASGTSALAAKRTRRWKHSVAGVSMRVAVSASLAFGSVSLGQAAIASNEADFPAPSDLVRMAPSPDANASLGEVNESFSELFAAFRNGSKLITNRRSHELAVKAAARRGDRPGGWAHKLASNVEDADD